MSGYFKPLRRKLGVVTLLAACVVTACWLRGLYFTDEIQLLSKSQTAKYFISANGLLALRLHEGNDFVPTKNSDWIAYPATNIDLTCIHDADSVEWQFRFLGCGGTRFPPIPTREEVEL